MKITKQSRATGVTHTREIPITKLEYEQWLGTNTLIQVAFPLLTPDEREFLISGVTPEEWDELFGEDDDEDSHTAH